MANDFEIVQSTRGEIRNSEPIFEEVKDTSGKEHLLHAVSDNFSRIVDVASSIMEIESINAKADAYVKILEEKRKLLAEEADSYVKKVSVDTQAAVSKVEAIRFMMQDYYKSGQNKMSGEEFSKIITEIINQIGVF